MLVDKSSLSDLSSSSSDVLLSFRISLASFIARSYIIEDIIQ